MNPSLAVEDSADRLEWACVAESSGYLAWTDVIRRLRLTVSKDEAGEIYGEPGEGVAEEGRPDIEPFRDDSGRVGGSSVPPGPGLRAR